MLYRSYEAVISYQKATSTAKRRSFAWELLTRCCEPQEFVSRRLRA